MNAPPSHAVKALAGCWLLAVSAGFAAWARYDATPGEAFSRPPDRPNAASRWTLVVYVHPRCPCATATLAELAEVVQAAGPTCRVIVHFVRPPGAGAGWERSPLWDRAAAMPGVEVEADADGEEARRAGGTTSGHAVLYDPRGAVRFAGGLTTARGRAGDNAGRRAVLAVLKGEEPPTRETPVFGCPLFTPTGCPTAGEGCHRE